MAKACKHGGYAFGEFSLDPEKRMLYRGEEEVVLPPKVVETLIVLVENRGEIVSKADLIDKVWSDSIVEEQSLSQHLYLLRKTLGDSENGRPIIETFRRRGYRFNAATTVLDAKPTPQPEVISRPQSSNHLVRRHGNVLTVTDWEPAPEAVVETPERDPSSSGLRGRLVFAFAAVGVAVVLIGSYWFAYGPQQGSTRTARSAVSEVNVTRVTTSGRTKRAAISPEGNHIAHVTDDSDGQSLWVRHIAAPADVRIAGPTATEYVSVTFSPDGGSVYYVTLDLDKGEPNLYRVPILGGPSSLVASDVGPVGFSTDGSRSAFLLTFSHLQETRLVIANADGSDQQTLATRRFPDYFRVIWNAPEWSADGRIVYAPVRENDESGPYETVIGVGVEDGREYRPSTARWQYVGQPRTVPDGLMVTASETETDPIQVWHVSSRDGAATRVTNDLNNYYDLSVASDAGRVAAVQEQVLSGLWVAPNADNTQAKQIGSEVGWIDEIVWAPDGRIFYRRSGSSEIWAMDGGGQGTRQITSGAAAGRGFDVTPDGRHLVFSSTRAGRYHIWRMNVDGTDLRQLTFGSGEFYPECSPDGGWIVYQGADEIDPTIWKIPFEGGKAVRLTDTKALRPAVSPDGKLVAYHYLARKPGGSRWGVGVASMDHKQQPKWFEFPPTVSRRLVRWSPDGRSIVYPNDHEGLSDLWEQSLEGGMPRKITDFKADQIITFDWSPDTRSLAFVRSIETTNVVLIAAATQTDQNR